MRNGTHTEWNPTLMNNFPSNWGPQYSPEYKPIMYFLVGLCFLGLASSLFPIVETIITSLLILCAIAFAVWFALYIRRERKLDWEAMYGPTTKEEKVSTDDK